MNCPLFELAERQGNAPKYDLFVNFDGGCWPNPGGRATWGIVVQNSAGEVVMEANGTVGFGPGMSNNVAEYHAAFRALQAIQDFAAPGWKVVLRGDSQIVIGKLGSKRVSRGLCHAVCLLPLLPARNAAQRCHPSRAPFEPVAYRPAAPAQLELLWPPALQIGGAGGEPPEPFRTPWRSILQQ